MEQGKPGEKNANTPGPRAENGTFARTTVAGAEKPLLPAPHSAGRSGKEPSPGIRGDTGGEVCRLNLNQLNLKGITGFTACFGASGWEPRKTTPVSKPQGGNRRAQGVNPGEGNRKMGNFGSVRSVCGY